MAGFSHVNCTVSRFQTFLCEPREPAQSRCTANVNNLCWCTVQLRPGRPMISPRSPAPLHMHPGAGDPSSDCPSLLQHRGGTPAGSGVAPLQLKSGRKRRRSPNGPGTVDSVPGQIVGRMTPRTSKILRLPVRTGEQHEALSMKHLGRSSL